MSYGVHDLLGNAGVGLILLTYLLMQTGRLDARGLRYSLANAVGASLVVLSLSVDFNLSAFIVEAFWVLISLYGIARALRQRRVTPSPPRP
jgi:hypothetical protein